MNITVNKLSFNRLAIRFEVVFGFLTILFFLLFSAGSGASGYPRWYSLGTTILELFAFFLAAILCLRNAFSSIIISSRTVWLGIGLGMVAYFVGNVFFAYWELGLQREPDVSPGDLFYILSYLLLMVAMGLAVFERRLNLDAGQYGVIITVGVIGVVVAILLAAGDPQAATAVNMFQPPAAIAASTSVPSDLLAMSDSTAAALTPLIAQSATVSSIAEPPAWVLAIEQLLNPFKSLLGFLYLIADTVLLIIATTLLLAYWGGRFAQSWRMIAAATFCLYIADAWFKFATTRLPNYQSGGLLEVGWVLSAILFGLGAALEYNASQLRRSSSRRRGL